METDFAVNSCVVISPLIHEDLLGNVMVYMHL